MEQLMRFTEKVVVVNGASRGIGRGIALRFAREGAKLVCQCERRRHSSRWQKKSEALGRQALSFVCDVTRKQEVEQMYTQVMDEFGRVDVSIQNAGVSLRLPKSKT